VWAGVDSVWEQEKLEARKMLENATESPASGARFVGWRFVVQDSFCFFKQVWKIFIYATETVLLYFRYNSFNFGSVLNIIHSYYIRIFGNFI